jgi:hypothetical protein
MFALGADYAWLGVPTTITGQPGDAGGLTVNNGFIRAMNGMLESRGGDAMVRWHDRNNLNEFWGWYGSGPGICRLWHNVHSDRFTIDWQGNGRFVGALATGHSITCGWDLVVTAAIWISGYHAEGGCVGARGGHFRDWVHSDGYITGTTVQSRVNDGMFVECWGGGNARIHFHSHGVRHWLVGTRGDNGQWTVQDATASYAERFSVSHDGWVRAAGYWSSGDIDGNFLRVRSNLSVGGFHNIYNDGAWMSGHNWRSRTDIHADGNVTASARLNAGDAVIGGHHLHTHEGWFYTASLRSNNFHADGNVSAHDVIARNNMSVAGTGWFGRTEAHSFLIHGTLWNSGTSIFCRWDGWCWGGWAAGGHDQGSITMVMDGGRNYDGSQYTPSLQIRWGSAVIPGDGPWGYWSDRRLKRNIDVYTCGLETLLKLKPVTFCYNERFCELYGDCVRPVLANTYVGLDADEALAVMPEIVRDLPPSRYNNRYNDSTIDGVPIKIINAGPVTYALINAVKELNDKNEMLAARVAALENPNAP